MRASELIAELQRHDPDAHVGVECVTEDDTYPIAVEGVKWEGINFRLRVVLVCEETPIAP